MFARLPVCTEQEHFEAFALTLKYAPFCPVGWDIMNVMPGSGLRGYQRRGDSLHVILSAARWPNDPVPERVWLHVSLARKNRMPSYEDMCDVKRLFVGPGRKALQVFAEDSQHVNIHSFALHLWCCVEGGTDGLPDFGAWGSI